ncbi:uncharacterized protein LOC106765257 isoform X2 [Vigna radiata var. radiata]|uniref:Uncharacterized protein LOC106765257 isoform X2 n=1 Tax=Vigna radiata var. radiata TaxID=3916 RepID=A0A1S3UGZ2_VIGRR|nr:uncharacterized protein LOC106765257 isoform X2 [Vigna radiata var. radiata]
MGLNSRDIQLQLSRVLHVSAEIGYSFMRKHPLVSGALLVFFLLYIFLSYIYNLLVFLSPFFVCIAIFVRIFWSSEQNQLEEDVKKAKEKRVEIKSPPKVIKNERRGMLYKCPSHNATSRRRNFTGKRLEVYGGLEIRAKDLSSVFRNEFTISNRDFSRRFKLYDEDTGFDFSEAPEKQTLLSEPVIHGDHGQQKNTENKVDVEKTRIEDGNKSVEPKEDDQKNAMDLGTCAFERHKRLESLMARRKARKQLKLQISNDVIDIKSMSSNQIAPLFISRLNHFDSPKEFEGIQMPGSAPSALRSPFDIPYDPFEEKPNLTGDGFDQELKNLLTEPRQQEVLEAKEHTHPIDQRLQGTGDNNPFEQLSSEEASESESKAFVPLSEEGKETACEENGKCETEKTVDINAETTNSNSERANESDMIPTIDDNRAQLLEKVVKPQEGDNNLPLTSANATKINDSLYESLPPSVEKNKATSFNCGPIRHTPSCSLASDLQVEVSEIGSPTLTVDENNETTTTTDGESIIYDGDIDKDVTSGSEDMWGASLHSREVRRVSEQDISELNSWRDISSPLSLQNIDEENAADVSSMSSDIPDDTPTFSMTNDQHNIFGVKDFVMEPSHSSVVAARWKRLMRLMDNRANHSEKTREVFNISENSSKAQVTNDGNSSTTSEQDNTHNSQGNEALNSDVQQEITDEVSINSNSSSSSSSSGAEP